MCTRVVFSEFIIRPNSYEIIFHCILLNNQYTWYSLRQGLKNTKAKSSSCYTCQYVNAYFVKLLSYYLLRALAKPNSSPASFAFYLISNCPHTTLRSTLFSLLKFIIAMLHFPRSKCFVICFPSRYRNALWFKFLWTCVTMCSRSEGKTQFEYIKSVLRQNLQNIRDNILK